MIRILDTVALLEDIQEDGVWLRSGEVGVVVEILAPGVYEIEFCDNQGRTYAFASLRTSQLLVLRNYSKRKESKESIEQGVFAYA
jgi:hypothetical protein